MTDSFVQVMTTEGVKMMFGVAMSPIAQSLIDQGDYESAFNLLVEIQNNETP